MTISTNPNSLKAALNRAQLQSIATIFEFIAIGDQLRALNTTLRAKAPLGAGAAAQYPYTIQAGAGTWALPDDAKAVVGISAYARAGTGTLGVLTYDGVEATAPAAGHWAISPSGDVVFNSTDAWTSVDVVYTPQKQDVVELVGIGVTSGTGVCTLPTTQNGVSPPNYVSMLEAEALAGTTTGKKVVGLPVAAAPSTGLAALNTNKLSVFFATADAVTSARLKLGVASKIDIDALLEATSAFI